MAGMTKDAPKRHGRPLYHAAKMSDRTFRLALWHFARDDTVAETSRRTGLSRNAVSTLFLKLRRFFVQAGLFTDIYGGGDPKEGLPDDPESKDEVFELEVIEFHFARLKAKRGVGTGESEDDHFAESHWRFHYAVLMGDRGGDAVHHIMHRHLLEVIRKCGPVGKPPVNRQDGLRLALAQMDERIRWAERNSLRFRDEALRDGLRSVIGVIKGP